jgi:hypothetical protein
MRKDALRLFLASLFAALWLTLVPPTSGGV